MRLVIFLVIFVMVAVIAGLLLRRRRSSDAAPLVDRMLRAYGAARCIEAVPALEYLAAQAVTPEIVMYWQRIELPLLQALPDCPPSHKIALREALEKCSRNCAHRDTARGIMNMRDALVR